jgi:hypothetical protein
MFLAKRRLAMLLGRLGESLMAAASVLVVGWSALVACNYNPNAPPDLGPGCFHGASTLTCRAVFLVISSDGDFALTFNSEVLRGELLPNTNYRLAQRYWFAAPLGTHLITGTTSASNLTIKLSDEKSTIGGGVQRGSLMSVTGPGFTTDGCSAIYRIPSGGARPQEVRLQYTIYAGTDACPAVGGNG